MSEVKLNNLYKVTMREYESGCQRDMGTKFFTTEEEAKQFCKEYFSGNSECYFRAEYERVN
jgi:hypothetical protein